jgi:glycosyltransferase involved in cell wall biosynthesis
MEVKICVLGNALSIHTKRLVTYLANKGYEVHVISFRRSRIDEIPVYHYEPRCDNSIYKGFHFLRKFKEIRRLIWTIKPDILHAHYLTSYGLLGTLSGFTPLVVSAMGTDLIVDSRKSLLHRFVIASVIKKSNLVTVGASHLAKRVRELGGDIHKTLKVTAGVNTEYFNLSKRPRGDTKRTVVLSCRVFEREQNVEYLIQAIAPILRKRRDIELHFCGDGSHRAYCQNLIRELGIEQNANFFGFVDHDQMPLYYCQADIYVSSSTSDADHISLMEALACGLFPVVSDIPTNREWIEDNKNGFLAPLNNPEIFGERILEAVKRRGIRERSRKYNFDMVRSKAEYGKDLEILEESYRKLFEEKGAF